MDVTVVQLPGLRLVGYRITGTPAELAERVPLAWKDLVRRQELIGDRMDSGMFYGAVPDREQDGAGGRRTYWTAVAAEPGGEVPPGMSVLTIPAAHYACATVQGGAEQIEASHRALAEWLRKEKRSTDPNSYALERFQESRQPVTPPARRFDYDLLRPLAPG